MATCTAAPLLTPSIVSMAVRLPAVVGLMENVTVSEVAVAALTVPTAPSLKTTVLLPGVGSKPKPLIMIVVAVVARLAVLLVTTGLTVATWIGAPLICESVVTTAVRLPAVVGLVENITVSEVAVAAVTVPTAPSLKTTVLWAAVVSNPRPVMVSVVAAGGQVGRIVRHGRRDGGHLDWRAASSTLSVVTTAVRLPAVAGFVENVTVSEVAVARGHVANRTVVEDDRVMGRRCIEAEAIDRERGHELAARLAVPLVTTGVTAGLPGPLRLYSRCR